MINIQEIFEKFADEYLKFDLVEDKLNPSPDICAFLLLNKLRNDCENPIIVSSVHDVIYLGVDCDELAKVSTEVDIMTLSRCGVMYDEGFDSLYMYV